MAGAIRSHRALELLRAAVASSDVHARIDGGYIDLAIPSPSKIGNELRDVSDDVALSWQRFALRIRSCAPTLAAICQQIKVHIADLVLSLDDAGSARDAQPAFVAAQRSGLGASDELPDPDSLRAERSLLVIAVTHLADVHQIQSWLEGLPQGHLWSHLHCAVVGADGGHVLWRMGATRVICKPGSREPSHAGANSSPVPFMRDPLTSDVAMAYIGALLLRGMQGRDRFKGHALPRHFAMVQTLDDLARLLQASRSSLYVITRDLVERRWVTSTRGAIPTLNDVPGMIWWFLDHARHRRDQRIAVQPLYRRHWRSHAEAWSFVAEQSAAQIPLPQSAQEWSSAAWAVTGWSACAEHGLTILADPSAKPIDLVTGDDLDKFLTKWELRAAPAGETPWLVITRTETPRAAFSGMSTVGKMHLPLVDPWQAALSVAGDPLRGEEQARALVSALWLVDT